MNKTVNIPMFTLSHYQQNKYLIIAIIINRWHAMQMILIDVVHTKLSIIGVVYQWQLNWFENLVEFM